MPRRARFFIRPHRLTGDTMSTTQQPITDELLDQPLAKYQKAED